MMLRNNPVRLLSSFYGKKPLFFSSLSATKPHFLDSKFMSHRKLSRTSEAHFSLAESKATLFDIAGYEYIKNQFAETISYLQNSGEILRKEISPVKGFILSGPPGTGKSKLAEAIAGHAGVPSIMISCSSLIGTIVGEDEKNFRELFKFAKANTPCVLILDEFDSIASKRLPAYNANAVHLNARVNQLLTLFAEEIPGLVIIATTNHYEILDPAVIRPGRFDKHIVIPLPDVEDRTAILKLLTKNKKISEKVNLEDLAKLSSEFSGAKLKLWVNEAALIAARENSEEITIDHFDAARTDISFGSVIPTKKDFESKRNTAIHEAGHALVGHLLGLKIHRISICRRGKYNGHTEYIPNDNSLPTKSQLLNLISWTLAGRASENIFGMIQSGFIKDLESATAIAEMMVKDEGMGSTLSGLSMQMDVEKILREQMAHATKILEENKLILDRLIEVLVKEEELNREQFLNVIAGKFSPKKSIRTSLFDESHEKKSDFISKIPSPKKYIRHIDSKVVTEDDKDDNASSSIPFTLDEVAKALEIDQKILKNVVSDLNDYKILFKPSFTDKDMIEEICTKLYKKDIASEATTDYFTSVLAIRINEDYKKEFVNFVKESNSPGNSPRL